MSDESKIIIRVTEKEKKKYKAMADMRDYTLTDLIKILLKEENTHLRVKAMYCYRTLKSVE